MDDASIAAREQGLHKGLSQRQVVMIGLGGAIGTGLFLGSSIAIGYAGPGVLISYAIAGFYGTDAAGRGADHDGP